MLKWIHADHSELYLLARTLWVAACEVSGQTWIYLGGQQWEGIARITFHHQSLEKRREQNKQLLS